MRWFNIIFRQQKAQIIVLYAVFLTGFMGMASLAVDVSNLYLVKGSFQNVADTAARAGTSGLVISQTEAVSRATNYADLNLSGQPNLNPTTTVTFSTENTIQVTIADPAVRLFFGGVIGIPTASVSAASSASLERVSSVTADVIPLVLYCNNPDGCDGILSVGQTPTVRRFCGNYFVDGSTCSDSAQPGEIFVAGVSLTGNAGVDEFSDLTYSGYPGTVSIGDLLQALEGTKKGWRDGMQNRLAEGRNEFTVPVVRTTGPESLTLEVFDFVKVRLTSFTLDGNTEIMTFQIVRGVVSTMSFASESQGYNIGSVLGVKIN